MKSFSRQEILSRIDHYLEDSRLEPYINAFNQYHADDFDLEAVLKASKHGKKPKTKTITFKRSTGTFKIVPDAGYCTAIPAPFQMVIEGSGNASHLGLFKVLNLACMGMDFSFMSPVFGTITAASGSEIHTQMGAPYPDLENPPNLFYPYTIIGGTDKYEDASGNFLMHGYTDPDTGLWSFTGEEEITY